VIARGHRDDDAKPAPVAPTRISLAPKAEAAPARTEPVPAGTVPTEPAPPAIPPKAEEPGSAAKEPKADHKAKAAPQKANAAAQSARRAESEAAAVPASKTRESDTVALAAPVREGTINIVALPWAEVFVDGTRQGVSPPLKAIPLRAGKHRVELRNGSFPPHVQTVDLRAGAEISITHRFRR
jgi:hypothetical protein